MTNKEYLTAFYNRNLKLGRNTIIETVKGESFVMKGPNLFINKFRTLRYNNEKLLGDNPEDTFDNAYGSGRLNTPKHLNKKPQEMKRKRLSYNLACLGQVISLFDLDEEIISKLYQYIIKYKDQRFGQIICNYICPDYRSEEVSEETKYIMNNLFPNNPDPFFEEPWETFKRYDKNY